MAPPDHGFSARLAGLAEAASKEARACRAADAAGFDWPPHRAADPRPPYELQPGTGRRGPEDLWRRFDEAVRQLIPPRPAKTCSMSPAPMTSSPPPPQRSQRRSSTKTEQAPGGHPPAHAAAQPEVASPLQPLPMLRSAWTAARERPCHPTPTLDAQLRADGVATPGSPAPKDRGVSPASCCRPAPVRAARRRARAVSGKRGRSSPPAARRCRSSCGSSERSPGAPRRPAGRSGSAAQS